MHKKEYDESMKKLKEEEHYIIQKMGQKCYEDITKRNTDNSGSIQTVPDDHKSGRMSTYELKLFGKMIPRPVFVQFTIRDESAGNDYGQIIEDCLKHVKRGDAKFCSIYKKTIQVAQKNKSDEKWRLNGIEDFETTRKDMFKLLEDAYSIMREPQKGTDKSNVCDFEYKDENDKIYYRSAWMMRKDTEIYTTLSRPLLLDDKPQSDDEPPSDVENKFVIYKSGLPFSAFGVQVFTCNLGSSYSSLERKYPQEDEIDQEDIERLDILFNFEAPGVVISHQRGYHICIRKVTGRENLGWEKHHTLETSKEESLDTEKLHGTADFVTYKSHGKYMRQASGVGPFQLIERCMELQMNDMKKNYNATNIRISESNIKFFRPCGSIVYAVFRGKWHFKIGDNLFTGLGFTTYYTLMTFYDYSYKENHQIQSNDSESKIMPENTLTGMPQPMYKTLSRLQNNYLRGRNSSMNSYAIPSYTYEPLTAINKTNCIIEQKSIMTKSLGYDGSLKAIRDHLNQYQGKEIKEAKNIEKHALSAGKCFNEMMSCSF